MNRKNINVCDVFNIERIGPNYSDHGFSLKFMGKTPGGNELDVTVKLPAWGVEYIAHKLHEVLKQQAKFIAESRQALRGEE